MSRWVVIQLLSTLYLISLLFWAFILIQCAEDIDIYYVLHTKHCRCTYVKSLHWKLLLHVGSLQRVKYISWVRLYPYSTYNQDMNICCHYIGRCGIDFQIFSPCFWEKVSDKYFVYSHKNNYFLMKLQQRNRVNRYLFNDASEFNFESQVPFLLNAQETQAETHK